MSAGIKSISLSAGVEINLQNLKQREEYWVVVLRPLGPYTLFNKLSLKLNSESCVRLMSDSAMQADLGTVCGSFTEPVTSLRDSGSGSSGTDLGDFQ